MKRLAQRLRLPLLILAGLWATTPRAGAAVYRWVDALGEVHYSQFPPDGGNYQRSESGAAAAAPRAVAPDTKKFLQQVEEANKAEAKARAEQQAAKTEAANKCTEAQQRLAYLDEKTARRLAVTEADGSLARMDEAEFERRRAAAQAVIERDCR